MPKAKKNFKKGAMPQYVDPSLDLDFDELSEGTQQYETWHWGYEPRKVVDWNDKDMPRMLIECGKLVRLHVRLPRHPDSKHPRRRRDPRIEFSRAVSQHAHIAYDPQHPYERLYLLIPKSQRQTLKKKFWDNNSMPPQPLNQLAQIAGGKHGNLNDYPNILCKPLGVLTAVVYYTAKKGDAPEDGGSFYIHEVGELSHRYPFLCIDKQGRLWLAGGSTTSPPAGITD